MAFKATAALKQWPCGMWDIVLHVPGIDHSILIDRQILDYWTTRKSPKDEIKSREIPRYYTQAEIDLRYQRSESA